MLRKTSLVSASLCAALAIIPAQASSSNILFILDASNSMWGQIAGEAKISSARVVMKETLLSLGADVNVGLMAYGHRRSGDCEDIEMLSAVGATPGDRLAAMVDAIQPRGRTPLAGSLAASWDAFAGREEEENAVVLVSDGIETCGGDPCAVAAQLRQKGVNVRIHTVGFDVDDDAQRQLQCIADAGGGQYFRAEDGAALRVAMAEVRQVAQAQPAAQPGPAPKSAVFFHDDFSGSDLADHWELLNADPNSYIVEGGSLLMMNAGVFGFRQKDTPNILRLKQALPDGDWTLVVRMRGELKTLRDSVWFGLYNDAQNFMGGHVWVDAGHSQDWNHKGLTLVRNAGGTETIFNRPIGGGDRGEAPGNRTGGVRADAVDAFVDSVSGSGAVLTMTKRGREYRASLAIDGEPVHETDALTSLRVPGQPALAVGQHRAAQGETLIYVDSVTIEAVE